MTTTRAAAAVAALALIPTVIFAAGSRIFAALAVIEAAVLAVAAAYAVYLGLYRYPR